MRARRTAAGLVLTVTGALVLTLPGAGVAAPAPVATAPSVGATAPSADPTGTDPVAEAEEALATVQELVESGPDAGTGSTDPAAPEPTEDLTIALTDLAMTAGALEGEERSEAEALLARPTDKLQKCTSHRYGDLVCYRRPGVATEDQPTQKRTCSTSVCVHYVNRPAATKPGGIAAGENPDAEHGVPVEDDGPGGKFPGTAGNDIPDYVDAVLATMTNVADTYVGAGYRPVASDGSRGGDARPDVYLGEIGGMGYYGYCTTDDPAIVNADSIENPSSWAYCVLDNDYTEDIFKAHSPLENMQVTAAHEYFHAVQYAYNVGADGWILEATATWAEDELYDDINDNVQFLPYGPMVDPSIALDTYGGSAHYASWIFFRYLTEQYGASAGGMPVLIRELWEDMAHSGADAGSTYSLPALRDALDARGTSFADQFAAFTVANLRPKATYAEAAENRYPAAKPWKRTKLTKRNPRRSTTFRLDHLSGRHLRYHPGTKGAWRLKLKFDVTAPGRGGAATITVKRRKGGAQVIEVPLKANGTRLKRIDFRRGKVRWVDVTVTNFDIRYACDKGVDRAPCDGRPRGDNKKQLVKAALVR